MNFYRTISLAAMSSLMICCNHKEQTYSTEKSDSRTPSTSSTSPAPAQAAPTVYHCRGKISTVTPAVPGKRAAWLEIDHEDIPGFMSAMRMEYRLADPTDAERVGPGEKVAFDLISQQGGDVTVTRFVELPAQAALKLASDVVGPSTRP